MAHRVKKIAFAAALAATTALGGCISTSGGNDGLYTSPIGNAPVTSNPTAYTPALQCLSAYARSHNLAAPRVAVGRIIDYTGAVTEDGGRRITQGGSLMAMSAFSTSGARLVERFDTSVSELELRYSNSRLIGEGNRAAGPIRSITAGQIPGSDYYFVGGITELNYNIRSTGADLFAGGTNSRDDRGSLTGRLYVMNIGLDFRLVDTRSLEVVQVVSYQKQIIGREVRAGVFSFFNDNLLDLSVGERALEPVQLAVRAGVERATVEVMSRLYGVGPDVCAEELASAGDPMGPSRQAQGPQASARSNTRQAAAAPAHQTRGRGQTRAAAQNGPAVLVPEAQEPAPARPRAELPPLQLRMGRS